jgi:hypothetical protein
MRKVTSKMVGREHKRAFALAAIVTAVVATPAAASTTSAAGETATT